MEFQCDIWGGGSEFADRRFAVGCEKRLRGIFSSPSSHKAVTSGRER